ncbi:type I polyketide synthase [Actinokineospora bangkokensis]|uniref:Erythronolide synthase n=1 Tax=Actinokineospora bangkokensis TaxID=1193682 RepID=A0A1Q9LJH6_9PSEU|nr:type I polyketide synthase [Actinokineospora bangkokensis]OLR92207.1 erythronolide synthase [Actinokineospora bangkokensis]
MRPDRPPVVVVVDPLHRPAPRSTAAAARAGALGVLELPADRRAAAAALADAARWAPSGFAVRVRPDCPVELPAGLPAAVHTVLCADPARTPADFGDRRVLVEVASAAEARAAAAAGAAGLVVRGSESGGRVGELSTFVLLQQVVSTVDVPVWAAGGIGPRTAAAAVAGGAAGVVLDTQLALLPEVGLPLEVAGVLAGLDGSETVVHQGVRVLRRRGPGVPELPATGAELAARLGTDLRTQFLPVGQDVFLAEVFAARFSSVAAAVRAVEDEVLAALDAPAPALVAQGPMTRVSDSPEFAAAVAERGGLPFLALALSTGEQTRDLLARTRDRLGDRPWGVGVLGFAAEDVRTAQLAEIRAAKPSHAIIAGGKPAQAAALEADGITTFLHVPSPGLLRQFLAAGSRRFIFEGAECGGHVGPRNSFPLWEAQVGVLLDHLAAGGDGAGLTVLFAGGVHDERSAGMVAALAAPLSAAGVEVGVLMGTAYLFTAEAVAGGAIGEVFQREVVAAEQTDLLETAPGHATRCVRSGFTDDFAALRADLAAQGVPDRDAWDRLERFNVGRLRLASKGIERVGAELRGVDEDRQRTEGMFMAGEVSVLRGEVTTIADLHAAVTTGAAAWLRERAAELRPAAPAEQPAPAPLRVAVVGMATMFPGATDLAEFWANVLSGRDSVTEVPATRWDASVYYDPDGDGERTPSRWGGFLPEIPFDPLRYGIPPASLAAIEPVQLLALEAARRALVDAGCEGGDHARTSVVFGAEAGSDLSNATTLRTLLPGYLGEVPAELDAQLPRLTEDSFPGVLANVIAGRIANRLDLGGANYTVDAACASSLTAVDVACKELVAGTSDLVLCGGADLHNGINDFLMFASVHALSPTGRSATFDSAADGIALGEGVACVVLKRLEDAERDGDRVYAVIDGVGSASDGRSLGLTAPRPEGQRAALERAYAMAGISPARVGLVEAHGTGTVVGDRTELRTITEVFTEAGAEPGSCAIGSVKSQIGHTKCAAGLAGLVKTALALHHGVKPPTLHVRKPNAAWDEGSPFAFHAAARPWAAEPADRVAGVSAFGFGGTNFHVVLRAHEQPPARHALDEWPVELFVLRGADPAAAKRTAATLLSTVEKGGWRLRDHARGAAARADAAAARGERAWFAFLAADVDDLAARLRAVVEGSTEGVHTADTDETGAVAFLYPGQGSQRPGMLAELLVTFPELHRYLHLGKRWAGALYPPAAFSEEAKAAQTAAVTDTAVAQPALGVVELAATELLRSVGVRPDMAAGHSYGELPALAAAGVFTPEDLLTASAARAQAVLDEVAGGDPGTMAAVVADAARVEAVLADSGLPVVAANHNSPAQTVVSGPTEAVGSAVALLRAAGLEVKPVKVACAFHSPVVAGAGARFAPALAGLDLAAPEVPVYANRTAAPYGDVRAELAAQLGAPVRFAEQVEAMHAAGARVFVEVGPGRVLSRLVPAVLGERPHRVVPLEEQPGLRGFLDALARLAVAGVDVRTGALVQGRDAVDPATTAARRTPGWTVDGHLVRLADGTIAPGALRPAHRLTEPLVTQHAPVPTPSGGDALIADFLRTSREMLAAQRDVLVTYFGGAERVPAVLAPAAPAPVVAASVAAAPALPAAAAPAPAAAPARDVLSTVVAVIAERTGYPEDMIDPELDLEADLSVDSIKRSEIAGEIAARLGLSGTDSDLEALSAARTAQAIADLLGGATAAAPAAPAAAAAPVADVLAVVTAVIAERTGYPVEMVEPGLDLEADLSVDSIKRSEIAGEIAARLGLSGSESDLEALSAARTAQGIADLLGATTAPAAATAPAGNPVADVLGTVTAVIAERTGYPVEMIEPTLDLEADLSVDSIKRSEIAGEIAARLGLSGTDSDLEALSAARTAQGIADLLGQAPGTAPAAAPADDTGADVLAPKRLLFDPVPLAAPGASIPTGTRVLFLGGDSADLAAAVAAAGATPTDEVRGSVVVHLGALDADESLLPEEFPRIKDVLAAGPGALIALDRRTTGAVTGLRGFFRTVAREYPGITSTLLEVPAAATADEIAAALVAEIAATDSAPVVLAEPGTRHALELTITDLSALATNGAGPAGDGAAEATAAGLDRDSVVVLAGGARGITARFARLLAATSRCRVELLGRTPQPAEVEDPATAGAPDRAALRAAFLAQGMRTPAEVEKAIARTLAEREVRATLADLAAAGSQARYHQVDMLDSEAVRATVKRVHADHGRIDGLVFAAGVIEDKLIADKGVESFRRVFGTKVDGARTLLDAVDALPGTDTRFAVLFGSIAAALGNRGQCDYAAANDALEELGRRWSTDRRRGLTVHWGPWAAAETGGGMVTAELMRSYAARGIALIDPEEGPLALLRELAYGPADAHAVVYTASGW